MRLDAFDYHLPEELIALRPARPRPASRMLVAAGGRIVDSSVARLGDWLEKGDLLVLNDTRVIPARLTGVRRRASGAEARIEATLIARSGDGLWTALARPGKRLAPGDRIGFGPDLAAEVRARDGAEVVLAFDRDGAALDAALETRRRGAAAALYRGAAGGGRGRPAGLPDGLRGAAGRGGGADRVAAFRRRAAGGPRCARGGADLRDAACRGRDLPAGQGRGHRGAPDAREWGEIGPEAAEAVAATLAAGGRVIPVGTTALRLLETAATAPRRIAPWRGETDIFIRPGSEFRIADGLMTNFHLPKSTLMMLVSALMGVERIRAIYAHAIAERYRFFSYGDSSLLLPGDAP